MMKNSNRITASGLQAWNKATGGADYFASRAAAIKTMAPVLRWDRDVTTEIKAGSGWLTLRRCDKTQLRVVGRSDLAKVATAIGQLLASPPERHPVTASSAELANGTRIDFYRVGSVNAQIVVNSQSVQIELPALADLHTWLYLSGNMEGDSQLFDLSRRLSFTSDNGRGLQLFTICDNGDSHLLGIDSDQAGQLVHALLTAASQAAAEEHSIMLDGGCCLIVQAGSDLHSVGIEYYHSTRLLAQLSCGRTFLVKLAIDLYLGGSYA